MGWVDGRAVRRDEWEGRPWLARSLRIGLTLLPFSVALVVSSMVARSWPRPSGWATVGWLLAISIISFSSMVATDRLTRRFIPLTVLLRMTLVFPDRAPSRFRVALRSANTRELDRTVERVKAEGLGSDADEAAETLLVMVSALTRHDRLTRGHSERTRAYTDLIAEEMGLTRQQRSKLRWAALLHDVGKVYVPARILNHPGKLSAREYEIVKEHAAHGARMIEPLREWLGEWADAVGQHHERWDGGGYPNGLAGEAISRGARIVAVADTFDVITSVRSYKKAQSSSMARAEIAAHAGTQFDPDVVRAFLSVGLGRFRFEMGPLTLLAQLPHMGFLLDVGRTAATVTTTGGAGVVAPAAAAIAMTGIVVPTTSPAHPVPELAYVETGEEDERAPARTGRTAAAPSPTIVTPSPTSSTSSVTTRPIGDPTDPITGPSTTVPTVPVTATTDPSSSPSSTAPGSVLTSVPPTAAPPATAPRTTSPTTAPPTTPPPTTPPTTPPPAGDWPSGVRAVGACLGEPVDVDRWRTRPVLDLTGCTFDGLDFSHTDLSGIDFFGGSWRATDFHESNLQRSTFTSVDLTDATFLNADLVATTFTTFVAERANFGSEALERRGLTFVDGSLDGALFAGSEFRDLSVGNDVSARGVDFTDAVVSRAGFDDVDLTGAHFGGAELLGTSLENARLDLVDFSSSKMSGTRLGGARLRSTDLSNVDFTGVAFGTASLDNVTFLDATGRLLLRSVAVLGPVTCPDGETHTAPPAKGSLCG